MHKTINPSLFREMNEPLENGEAADAAVAAFLDGVAELRKKHHIANVYCVAELGYKAADADGGEQRCIARCAIGDASKVRSLTAWAYGYESAQAESDLAASIASARQQGKDASARKPRTTG